MTIALIEFLNVSGWPCGEQHRNLRLMRICVLLPLLLLLGSCKEAEEPSNTTSSPKSLEDNIVGKVLTLEGEGEIGQMMFREDGVVLMGQDGDLRDDLGLTYKVEENQVVIFQDGGKTRDGAIIFPSASPKVGVQVEAGPEGEKQTATITKIGQPVATAKFEEELERSLGNASKIKSLQNLRRVHIVLYSKFGGDLLLPDKPLEEIIVAEVGNTELTRIKNPATGEIRQLLYNHLTDFSSGHIMLASPWVQDEERAVVYGDGRGELIPEEKYQQEIQKDEVEMRSLK